MRPQKIIVTLSIVVFLLITCSKNDNGLSDTSEPEASESSNPFAILTQADDVIDYYLARFDTLASLQRLATWFSENENTSLVKVCDESSSLSIVFSSGLRANYALRTTFDDIVFAGLNNVVKPKLAIMEAGDAKIIKVFGAESRRSQQLLDETIEIMTSSLDELGFSVDYHDSTNTTLDIDFFRRLFINAPPVLTIFTHGINHSTETETLYGLATLEEVPEGTENDPDDYAYGVIRLRSSGKTYWTLLRDFASRHFNPSDKCYFTLHACNVAQDTSLIQGFMAQADTLVMLTHNSRANFNHIHNITENLYASLTDTFTIQQAYDDLSHNYGAGLFSKPDAHLLLGETFVCNFGPSREHFFAQYVESMTGKEDGDRIPSYTITANVCASAEIGCDSVLNIVVPRTTGTYHLTDGVFLILFDGTTQFSAVMGCRGVSGTVTISALADGILSGSYRATLGTWPPGQLCSEHNPVDTRTIEGYFKIE